VKSYRVQAYNTAHSSENKIHDDAVARRFGFSGALVPGVDVYAYMMHLPVARWGRAFLERGTAQCRFTNPVYDGETAEVSGRDEGDALVIEVTSGGKSCATGSARLPAQAATPRALGRFPSASPPAMENRPAASPATLPVGGCLGSIPFEANAELAAGYLRDVRETDDLYSREGLVHPGTVLRMCNLALLRNVLLGPWIHVGSAVQNFSAARVGEILEARACVAANDERKGHLFVELDVLVLGAGTRPVAAVRHTAIYRPRQITVSSQGEGS
jgi:hydrogenase maturation factor